MFLRVLCYALAIIRNFSSVASVFDARAKSCVNRKMQEGGGKHHQKEIPPAQPQALQCTTIWLHSTKPNAITKPITVTVSDSIHVSQE